MIDRFGFQQEFVPPFVKCRSCNGRGKIDRRERQSLPSAVTINVDMEDTITIETLDCMDCEGTGNIQMKIPERVKIYQKDEFVGTVPSIKPEVDGPSVLVQIRPYDYAPTVRDGEIVLEAHSSICPGDFAALKGFDGKYRRNPELEAMDKVFGAMVAKGKV